MGKKKAGKKAEGGGEGKLPPPPNLDNSREGVVEALLSFKIRGKEEQINQYEEEAEVFKDRNYHQKERNYQLKKDQGQSYQTLVQQFRKYQLDQDQSEVVEKEKVEEALKEKVMLVRRISQELSELEGNILSIDLQLQHDRDEVQKWQTYKDQIQHEQAAYISAMEQRIQEMNREEHELRADLERKMGQARLEAEQQTEVLLQKHKELVSARLVQNLDRDSKEEMADNIWMHQQITFLQGVVVKLQLEKDALERRNLQRMETMQARELEEVEMMKELHRSSMRKGMPSTEHGSSLVGSSGSGLPSLVDVSKCTADEGPGGQLGQLEMRLLSVQGARVPMAHPPDTVHLPPIDKHRSTHTALPQRTAWPVTTAMLNSVV